MTVSQPPIPPAPWHLEGAALCFPTISRRGLGALLLVRYSASPVGAYCELAVAHLTRRGPTVTQMPVNLEASRRGGREIWGFPKTLALLEWRDEPPGGVRFETEKSTLRARAFGPRLPLKLRAWTVQNLNGQSVRVPVGVAGRVRLARCGRRWGAMVEPFALDVDAPQPL